MRSIHPSFGPTVIYAGAGGCGRDVETVHCTEKFLKADQVEAGSGTGFDLLPGCEPPSENDRGQTRNIWPMNLPGDHEDTNGHWLTVSITTREEHVKAAFIGAQRVEEERQAEQAFGIW